MRSGPLLQTEGLTKAFGGLRAVDSMDFSVRPGELRAVIGPNGAGKTTLFNLITGRLAPTRGKVFFKGGEITALPPHEICRRGVARTFQITSLFPNLTVSENIWTAVQGKGGHLHPLRPARKMTHIRQRVEEVLRLLGLEEQGEVLAVNLSHGDQRLLEIGVALATTPELLLLDEPTAGMSLKETREMVGTIKGLAGALTIVIVEHDMGVVMELAQTITVLDLGRIIAEGPPEEIRRDRRVQEVYLGSPR